MSSPPVEPRPQFIDLDALINRQGLELRVSDPAKLEQEREEDRHRRRLEVLRFWFFAPGVLGFSILLGWIVVSETAPANLKGPALSGILAIVSAAAGFLSGRATAR